MIDLAKTSSAGAIAAEILFRARVRAPHLTFGLSNDELIQSSGAYYGGWCEAHPRASECQTLVVSCDVASAFPLLAHLAGWWDLVCGEEAERVDSTTQIVDLCKRARTDPTTVLDPAIWQRLGCTIVQAVPHGERWPIEIEDEHRPDGRSGVTEVDSLGQQVPHTAHDALNAAVLPSATVSDLETVSATTYRPIGRQSSIRDHLDVRPDLQLDLNKDPALALVEYRRCAKENGDLTLAAALRVIVNALVYGNFCRFDPIRQKVGGTWVPWDRPGPWVCMPIASTVTGGSRLVLGILERMVRDLGGLVLYRDTDSSIIPATRYGGERVFADDSRFRCLSWAEIDAIVAVFAPLSPSPSWPIWKIEGVS